MGDEWWAEKSSVAGGLPKIKDCVHYRTALKLFIPDLLTARSAGNRVKSLHQHQTNISTEPNQVL